MARVNKLRSAGNNWITEAFRVRQSVDPKLAHIIFNQFGDVMSNKHALAIHSEIRKTVEDAEYSTEIRKALIDCYKDASRWAGHCSVVLEDILTDRLCLNEAVHDMFEYYMHIPCASFVFSYRLSSYIPIDDEEIMMYIRRANEIARCLIDGLGRFGSESTRVVDPIYRPSKWFSDVTRGGLNADRLRMSVREDRLKRSKQLGTRWHHDIDEVCEVYQEYAGRIRTALLDAK